MKVQKCIVTDVIIRHQHNPTDSLTALHVKLLDRFVTTATHMVALTSILTPTGSLRAEPVVQQFLATSITTTIMVLVTVATINSNAISAHTLRVTVSYELPCFTGIFRVCDSENSLELRALAPRISAPPVKATAVLIQNPEPR